jgi:hypothetical protein
MRLPAHSHFDSRSNGSPSWGMPINQEDQAGTLLIVFLHGAKRIAKIGGEPDAFQNKRRICTFGLFAGFAWGLMPELIVLKVQMKIRHWKMAIRLRHFRESEHGQYPYSSVLLDYYRSQTPVYLSPPMGRIANG